MDNKVIKQVYKSSYQNPEELEKSNSISNAVKSTVLDKPKTNIITDQSTTPIEKNQNDTKLQSNQVILTDSSFSSTPKKSETKKSSKIIDKIKSIKNFEIYIAIIFVVLVLIIYFSSSFSCTSGKKPKEEDTYQSAYDYCQQVEKKLKNILSTIKNAGAVDVMITFESTPERVIAYITSSSSNISSGGNGIYNENTTNTSNPQVIYVDGDQIPLILKEISPKVIGVLVVAEGADDVKVKLDIINAVSVVLDVNADQIKVLTMNKG